MRYYLHLRDGHDIAIDEEGMEFDSRESLHDGMCKAARDIMAGDVLKGRLDLNLRIDAETRNGRLVDSLRFSQALEIVPAKAAA